MLGFQNHYYDLRLSTQDVPAIYGNFQGKQDMRDAFLVRFSGVLYFQTNNAAALHMSLANRRRVREATNGACW